MKRGVVEGLEPVRLRAGMYVGESTARALLEAVVANIVGSDPAPAELRISLFADGVVAVAFDGDPLPITPIGDPPHPEFYALFLHITHTRRPLGHAGCLANALSVRLVASTTHHGVQYRAAFSRGGVTALLTRSACDTPLGTNWLVFEPDPIVLSGGISLADVEGICRSSTGDVRVIAIDRSGEECSWSELPVMSRP